MLFINIPNDFCYLKSVFGRPELVSAYALLSERAARPVASKYQNLGIQRGECVISASYLAGLMATTDSLAASYLRSLEHAGLIIRKKLKGLTECVFQIPTIFNPAPGEFTTVYLPENKRIDEIWKTNKHLLQVYFFLATKMARKKEYSGKLKKDLEKNFVGTTLEEIKYYCNCTINEVRGALKWLESIAAIVKEGFQGIGMRIFMAVMAKFGKKTEEKPKTEQVKTASSPAAAPVKEQPRTVVPSPIVADPPVPAPPPPDPIRVFGNYYLDKKEIKKKATLDDIVKLLRIMYEEKGYDLSLYKQCVDAIALTPLFKEYPNASVVCGYIDAWYCAHAQGVDFLTYYNQNYGKQHPASHADTAFDRRRSAPCPVDTKPEDYE